MRPDQERVRNLLIDTVTLLCKNSLQFDNELHVEGLLGVSVDKKDVFFVHISKEFTNSPSEGATVTQNDSQDEETRQSHGSIEKDNDKNLDHSQNQDIKVKTETFDEEEDECSIVEDPNIKLEGVASPAQMVAGQRRAYKRASHSNVPGASLQDYSGDDSNLSAGYAMGDGTMDSQYMGEPPHKRRNNSQDEYGGGGDEDQGSAWPTISGISGFDPSQTFQDTDNGLMGTDSTQPGCSTWSTPGRGPSDSDFVYERPGRPLESGRRDRVCSVCGKMFSRPAELVRHMPSHTGEKPFLCAICGKGFTQKSTVKAHALRVHRQTIVPYSAPNDTSTTDFKEF